MSSFFFYRWEMPFFRPPTRKISASRTSGTVGLSFCPLKLSGNPLHQFENETLKDRSRILLRHPKPAVHDIRAYNQISLHF